MIPLTPVPQSWLIFQSVQQKQMLLECPGTWVCQQYSQEQSAYYCGSSRLAIREKPVAQVIKFAAETLRLFLKVSAIQKP